MVCRDLHAAIHYDGLHIITIMIYNNIYYITYHYDDIVPHCSLRSTEHDSVRCGDVTR
jgi:hypothetical protein